MAATTTVRLLTTREVADLLRVSEWRIRELVAEGILHPLRLSTRGRMRFRVEEVERLIAGEH